MTIAHIKAGIFTCYILLVEVRTFQGSYIRLMHHYCFENPATHLVRFECIV